MASAATRDLMAKLSVARMKASVGEVPKQSEQSHSRFDQVTPMQNGVNANIADIYTNLDKT
jgi:hypothetical protein